MTTKNTYQSKTPAKESVRAWRWAPKFNDGEMQPDEGSARDEANSCWLHPSGVSTPDNGNPSYVTTSKGVERPKIGDFIVLKADGTRAVMSAEAFAEAYGAA
jgi:hypothetical protein